MSEDPRPDQPDPPQPPPEATDVAELAADSAEALPVEAPEPTGPAVSPALTEPLQSEVATETTGPLRGGKGRPRHAEMVMTGVMPPFELSDSPIPELDEAPAELKRWTPGTSAGQAEALLPAKSASSASIRALQPASPLPQFAPTGTPAEEAALASHRKQRWRPGDEFVPGEGENPAPAADGSPGRPTDTYAPRPISGISADEIDQPMRRPSGSLRPVGSRSSAAIPLVPAPPPPSPWQKFATPAAMFGLVLLLVSAAVPWLSRAHERAVAPDHASLQRAAAIVAKDLQAGDALAFTPDWGAHEAWLFDQAWTGKGLKLDDDLLWGDPYDPWTADGHRRLWLVGTHDRFERAEVGAIQLRREDVGHGTVVGLYQLPHSTTAFDFRRQLSSAHAKIRLGEANAAWRDCPWRGDPQTGRHACGGAEYQDVWQGLHEVGGTRRECIFVHPPGDHGTLRLTFGDLPAGTELQGRLGNRLWAVRHGDTGTPVRFTVLVGGEQRWEKTLPTDDFSYYRWSVPLRPTDAGKEIAFEIYADQEAWREACFDARLIGRAGP